MEVKLIEHCLFLGLLVLEVGDLFADLLLLLLDLVDSLLGETNLNQLEEDLEVGEEFSVFGWLIGLHDLSGDRSLLALSILVDLGSHLLEVVLVESLWLAFSDALSESLGCELLLSIFGVGCVHVLGHKLHQVVEDIGHGLVSLVGVKHLLDVLDVLLISILDILVLLLVHGLDQILELVDLGTLVSVVRLLDLQLILVVLDGRLTFLDSSVSDVVSLGHDLSCTLLHLGDVVINVLEILHAVRFVLLEFNFHALDFSHDEADETVFVEVSVVVGILLMVEFQVVELIGGFLEWNVLLG